jgi:cell volume regulation protein A
MPTLEQILLAASILLALSIAASKISARLGVPALLLFLAIGMLAGSEGIGGIYFDDARSSQALGVVALVFILFAGGLDTNWLSIHPVVWQGIALATLGVFITAAVVGWLASTFLSFSTLEGLLIGAIVASTDAAAVFSVLRSRSVGLRGNLKPLLELESGSNDPMAIFLTIGLTRLLADPAMTPGDLLPLVIQQMVLGVLIGYGMGRAMVWTVNRLRLEYEGLYPALTIALVLFTYSATAFLGGSGFLAVYLAGLILGNRDFIHKRSLLRFHDGLAWLMQIVMFLTLGLLVFPSQLVPIMPSGLLLSAVLILIARPVSVFIALLLTRLDIREKLFISWVGLRGAAPIVLATFPLLAGVPQAGTIFNIIFFVVLTSVLLQGTSIVQVARWLGVDAPEGQKTRPPFEFVEMDDLRNELLELVVPENSSTIGNPVIKLGLPPGSLIVLLGRDNEFIVPGGSTMIEAGDQLLILADKESREQIKTIIYRTGA